MKQTNNVKNYLGDVKWVLYQYICDMNSENITIRCGNYALNKLTPMAGITSTSNHDFILNLNGEKVTIYHVPELDKKQLIISNHNFVKNEGFSQKDLQVIHQNDVVLYFA